MPGTGKFTGGHRWRPVDNGGHWWPMLCEFCLPNLPKILIRLNYMSRFVTLLPVCPPPHLMPPTTKGLLTHLSRRKPPSRAATDGSRLWTHVVNNVQAEDPDAHPPKDKVVCQNKLQYVFFLLLYLFVAKFDEKHATNTAEYIADFLKVCGPSTFPQFPVMASITPSPLVAVSAAAAAAIPGVSVPVSSAGAQITAMAGIAPSPLVAVSAASAPTAASSVSFGAGAQATSADGTVTPSQLALGSNFHYDFDLDFRMYLDNPSFAYQPDPNAHTWRLNTSNRDSESWGFGSDGANDLDPSIRLDNGRDVGLGMELGSSASLALPSSSSRGDGYIFPAALSTSNANTAAPPTGYLTSVFSATGANVEKRLRKPRKKKGGADGDAQPKPKKRKTAALNATAAQWKDFNCDFYNKIRCVDILAAPPPPFFRNFTGILAGGTDELSGRAAILMALMGSVGRERLATSPPGVLRPPLATFGGEGELFER
ncbi:hypothetical protein B0H14DRAFT_2556139 [Mycena olivaceomarginata]|nr:hypothetical protein B0H14DRAFT_2556139 [Mycena olivaceomarginata]